MRKLTLCVCALMCLICSGLGALAQDEDPAEKPAEEGVKRLDVPEEYAKKEVPDLEDSDRIEKGRKLFNDMAKANCAMCHGEGGKGDGVQAANYTDPPVGDLTTAEFQGAVTDQYIFWRIKEPVESKADPNSGMLGYPNGKDDDIWDIVAFIRSVKAPTLEVLSQEAYEAYMGDLKTHWGAVRKHAKEKDKDKTLAAAEAIAEIGPKLKGYDGGQDGKKVRDQDDFKQFCDDITKAAADYAKLVNDGDWAKAGEIQGKIGGSCKSCHDKYKK